VRHTPLEEAAHRRLMELLSSAGDGEGALLAYEGFRDTLNAWCELAGLRLSGRRPRFRVGLLPDPERKGTGLPWSTWTPSSPHFTL
jgi:hypothetical protein